MKLFTTILILCGALTLAGCRPSPQEKLDAAEDARIAATNARAHQYASELFLRADSLLDNGRMEMARQKGALSFLQDFDAADSMLLRSAAVFEIARNTAADSLARLKASSGAQLRALESDVEGWRAALDSSLTLFNAEGHFSVAHINYLQAKQLFEAGEYTESMHQVAKAQEELLRLNRIFDDHANHENGQVAEWQRWVEETIEYSRRKKSQAIVVDKQAHTLYLIESGRVAKTYACELGYNSAGQKNFAGDGATPEGRYEITSINNSSKYYRALLLDYPNDADRKRFKQNRKRGLIPRRAGIGRLIEIHGDGGQKRDWTEGCVALTNSNMDDLMKHVGEGTPVTIVRRWTNRPS